MAAATLGDPSEQVASALTREVYELVWVFRAELAARVQHLFHGIPTVVDADDHEVDRFEAGRGEHDGLLLRAFRASEVRRYTRVHRRLARGGAVLCFARDPQPPVDGVATQTIRNGLADPGFIPPGVRAPVPGRVAFLGLLTYEPNREAVVEVGVRILPALRAVEPATNLSVIGLGDSETNGTLRRAGAEVLGFVPNLANALAGVTAIVTPVRTGSGTSIKAIECLARGVPLISTEFGVRGLGLVPGIHYLQADTPDDFAAAWSEICVDYPARAEQLADAGRRHYEQFLSQSAVAQDVQDVIQRARESRRDREKRGLRGSGG